MISAVPALQPYLNALSCHDGADFVNLRGIGQWARSSCHRPSLDLSLSQFSGFGSGSRNEAAAPLGELVERVSSVAKASTSR
jgi:hypothetical protein